MSGPAAEQRGTPAGQPGTRAEERETPAEEPETPAEQAGPDVEELHDRWRRAVAELDNLRKRYERQLDEQRRAERASVVAELLPVVDSLELALRHAQADPAAIVPGVRGVYEQALATLARLGFTRLDDLGAPFDPARHEAARIVDDPEAEPGSVVEVLRPGYIGVDDRLLRATMVSVARKPD